MSYVDILLTRNTIRLTPGRQKLAAMQMLERMRADERAIFAIAAGEAIEAADRAESLSAARRLEAPKVYGDEARDEDTAADASASIVFGILEGYMRRYPASSDLGAASRRLLEALFPHGKQAVTQARYAEEVIQLERIVTDAKKPELAADVRSIPGLEAAVEDLGVTTRAYRAALSQDAREGVSYKQAQAAVDEGDRRVVELVAMVLTHYRGDAIENMKRRTELVTPYLVTMNDLRERYRRRLPPGEVDSATGDLVEGSDVAVAIVGESAGSSASEQ
jgi:hypothetical protein